MTLASPDRRLRALAPTDLALAAGLSLALYLLTLAPGAWWGDSASLASHLETSPKPFARSYWLYKSTARLLALLLPGGPALSANAATALFGAVGCALVNGVVQRLTGSRPAALGAAAALAVAHSYWSLATVAEVYTLHVCFQLGILFLALGALERPREALGLGLLLGLSLNHHRMILACFLPVLLWLSIGPTIGERRSALLRVAAGLGLGAIPFLVLCVLHPPSSLSPPPGLSPSTLWLEKTLLGGHWSAELISSGAGKPLLGNLRYVAAFTVLNFPSPALLLAPLGLASLWSPGRRALAGFLALLVLGAVAVALRFSWAGDQFAFLVPLHPLLAVLCGLGLAQVLQRSERAGLALAAAVLILPIALYAALGPGGLGAKLLPDSTSNQVAEFFWPGRTGCSEPEDWAAATLEELPPDSLLVSQWEEGTVLEYLVVSEGLRPDVEVLLHRSGPVDLDPGLRPTFVTWRPDGTPAPPEAVQRTGLRIAEAGSPGLRRVLPSSSR